jgi:hypothetical protein
MEKILVSRITPHFKHIIVPEQHGFMRGRSTSTNLLVLQDFIVGGLESNYQTDVIYTDFSKAFDRVNHKLLISKLNSLGIHGKLLSWFESYLNSRSLIVRVNHDFSEPFPCLSGVPQGSHLGPLLFCLFINDVYNIFNDVDFLLFADDLKIYKHIASLQDSLVLQKNIDLLVQWADANDLSFNVQKCSVMTFHHSCTPYFHEYTINSTVLGRPTAVCDLGVWFDSQLSFKVHLDRTVCDALKNLGFIKRVCQKFNNVHALRAIYIALVRSKLEYSVVNWSPYYNIDSACLNVFKINFSNLLITN